MLDIKFVRNNPDLVKENIKKKFQDEKLPLVDKVIEYDEEIRACKTRGDELRNNRNSVSREIGQLMKAGKKDEAEEAKKKVTEKEIQILTERKRKEEEIERKRQERIKRARNF